MRMQRFDQSPTDPAFVQSPYATYARMRAAGPLIWWEDYGLICATTHAAVHSLLRDRRFGREVPPEDAPTIPDHQKPFYAVEAHSMLELEPPRHTRLRKLVLRAFTTRRIAALAPDIAALCHRLIDDFPEGPFDLLQGYCQPVPVAVICWLLGVPQEMAPQLLRWSADMVGMYQARRDHAMEVAAATAAAEFSDYLRGYVDARRKSPGEDLISELIAAEEEGERLTTDELITTCILLLNAGHEATVHSLGNGVAALLREGIVPTEDSADAVVEEILRHDPPLHLFTRYAYEEVEAFGHTFQRGDQVGLLLGSAARDDGLRADPDRFAPDLATPKHTSFGGGLHFCVGAPLARLEMTIALPILWARCPGLRLAEPVKYADLYHFHGLERLQVVAG